jgi:hypothetical protein
LHGGCIAIFKAIELDPSSRQRTGVEYALESDTRQRAIEELLCLLQIDVSQARIDPTRTLVQLDSRLWTIVAVSISPNAAESSALRRAGAKHRRVR